jgi:hypothetical protein
MKEPECDTDTDGDEMTLQEITCALAVLAAAPSQTEEFYAELSLLLGSSQSLPAEHAATNSCVELVEHVVIGLADVRVRAFAVSAFALMIRNRTCVHKLLKLPFALPYVVRAVEETCDPDQEPVRLVLLASFRLLCSSRGCRTELLRCGGVQMMLTVVTQPGSDFCKVLCVCLFCIFLF